MRKVHKKNAKKFFALLLAVSMCTVSLPALAAKNAAQTAENGERASGLAQVYRQGETVSVQSFEMEYEGKKVTFSPSYCILPSGKKIKAPAKLALEMPGQYTVEYTGKAGDRKVTRKETFVVSYPLYSTGSKSSTSYGTIPADYYETYVAEKDVNGALKNKEGLLLRLATNETFTYNRVLDLTDWKFNVPIISLFCLPETPGSPDAQRIQLRLTDIYDENNYVDLYISACSEASQCDHLSAVAVGYNGTMTYESHWAGGGLSDFSVNLSNANLFTLIYDDATLTFDTTPRIRIDKMLEGTHNFPSFSDKDYFDTPWAGFTTGECRLSITAKEISASELNLMIYDVCGEQLDGEEWIDDTVPAITVDYAGYEENELPGAAVGKPYRVFKAAALSGKEVLTEVYYNYYSDAPYVVDVVDGCFVPQYKGLYSIVYSLTGANGVTNRIVSDIYADREECFSFELTGAAKSGKSGQSLKICDEISEKGKKHGRVSYDITVVHKETGREYKIAAEDKTFIPMDAGEYTVTVTGKDYVTEFSEEITVSVEAGDTPLILDRPLLPKYMIKNAAYPLPKLEGYVFSSGKAVTEAASLTAYEDGSSTGIKAEDGSYTVKAGSQVRLVYTVEDAKTGKTAELEKVVPVVDVNFGDILNGASYFVSAKGQSTVAGNESGMAFTASKEQADGEGTSAVEFINAVQTKKFTLEFSALTDREDYQAFHLYLTDAMAENNILKLSFYNEKGKTYIKLNERGKSYELPGNLFDGSNVMLTVSYSSDQKVFKITNKNSGKSVAASVAENLAGEKFSGFNANRAYCTLELGGVTGNAGVLLEKINNQNLGLLEADYSLPQYFTDVNNGLKNVGDVIHIAAADICDVLDPNVKMSLSVIGPENEIVTSKDGITMDVVDAFSAYEFVVEKAGSYIVRYAVSDSENQKNIVYNVEVVDNATPVLTLKKEPVSFGKVGDVIAVPEAEVKGEAELDVWLQYPGNGTLHSLRDADGSLYNGFEATKKGIYTIYYTVKDEAGNYDTKVYKVTIE